MKKQHFVLSLALAAMPLVSLAQEATLDSSVNVNARPAQVETRVRINAEVEARRAEMDARRAALRAEAETKRAEVRTAVQENRAELREDVVERKLANTVRVMSATIERLENIASRIDSRIEKIKARGGDTTESERYLAEARRNLADAKASVGVLASAVLSGETIREDFERIRALAVEVRGHLRNAHTNLMLSVRNLSSVELEVEAEVEVSN